MATDTRLYDITNSAGTHLCYQRATTARDALSLAREQGAVGARRATPAVAPQHGYPQLDTTAQLAINEARHILFRHLKGRRLVPDDKPFTTPEAVKDYLFMQLAARDNETFAVLFLDNQHRLAAYEELITGTVNASVVYPREVIRRGLSHNASAAILVHNHPSGSLEPSEADHRLTRGLKTAMEYVEIRLLDHIIVGEGTVSFVEKGWMP